MEVNQMGMYKFTMSCGHEDTREVADPKKYLDIDRKYYAKQGLCKACWDKVHENHRKYQQSRTAQN